jgi:hypothetical protein
VARDGAPPRAPAFEFREASEAQPTGVEFEIVCGVGALRRGVRGLTAHAAGGERGSFCLPVQDGELEVTDLARV